MGSLLTIGPTPTQGSVSGSDSVPGSASPPSELRSGLEAAIFHGKQEKRLQEVTFLEAGLQNRNEESKDPIKHGARVGNTY
ncbi:hypothetical protein JZ751_001210 [Albula glossodonta]|uniref:Uncharacterized protein n=1 Tax=Albula glossodonta TaxID=121402 RepID=A0A8T2PT19_9TELE|nr:hypothetical protein JZ751_001210 [Albula glossodonta]